MRTDTTVALSLLLLLLGGCAPGGGIDTEKAVILGASALQVSMLDNQAVRQAASLSAQKMDSQSQIAPAGSPYAMRLVKLTSGLQQYDGLDLNFKVYLSKEVNAFAMADGTVRVYSGLMDIMPDDQVLAVIGHEIGHVRLRHTFHQMREVLLTNVAFDAAASIGGTIANLTSSQLGSLAHAVVNARYSQSDELEADAYAVRALKQMGRDPYAMLRSIETLEQLHGSRGGFLSSHPSNRKRIDTIQEEIRKL